MNICCKKILVVLLAISLSINIFTLYKISCKKTALITSTHNCMNNISEYLICIENALVDDDSNALRLNCECLRYECLLIDISLNELSSFLYAPKYKPTFTDNFSTFYANEIRIAIAEKNLEKLQTYTELCEGYLRKLNFYLSSESFTYID